MLLYWGMFTVGFTIGAVFSFITFAAKTPEDESVHRENPGAANGPVSPFVLSSVKTAENGVKNHGY